MRDIKLPLSAVVSFVSFVDLLEQIRKIDAWERRWTPAEADAVWELELAMRQTLVNDKHHKRAEAAYLECSFAINAERALKSLRKVIAEDERDTEWLHDEDDRRAVAKMLRSLAASLERPLSTP